MRELNEYLEAINKTCEAGEKLINIFLSALKPIIPDVRITLGWVEAGIDTICFWSKSHSRYFENTKAIVWIVKEIFPELNVDAPGGFFLSKEEEDAVKVALLKLRKGDMDEIIE